MLNCPQHPETLRTALPMRPRNANWIPVSDAADLLGVTRTTVHKWRVAGHLDTVRTQKFGAQTYYWRPDVETFRDRLAAGPDEPTE